MATPIPRAIPTPYGLARAAFVFAGGVREALHRGKFESDLDALRQLAELTAQRLDLVSHQPAADAVVAVPLGARRRRTRGYNQAEILARPLAGAAGLPLAGGLERIRETRPQSSRDEVARRRNIEGAFRWRGPALQGAALLLVDDVLTTGATVEAAAATLSDAGARRVNVITVARVP